MKILLAIDESKFSEAALQSLIAQVHRQDAEVRVLHVVEPIAIAMPPLMAQGWAPELDDVKKEQLKRARELVGRAADQLRAAGFKAEAVIREDNARAGTIDTASEWHADLIVLGSHGLTGLDRFLLGSVSEFVARHARCSVQIVRIPQPAKQDSGS